MAALITGFRETFEVAVVLAALLAVVNRLSRRDLAQALWYGLAAGLGTSFAVGTGLQAARADILGVAVAIQPAALAIAALALGGFVICLRRTSAATGCAWLAVAVVFAVALPQGLELMGRALALADGLRGLLGVALGFAGAVLIGFLIYEGLTRVNMPRLGLPRLAAARQTANRKQVRR